MICDMCHKREAIGIIRIGERQVHMCTLCLLLGAPNRGSENGDI